MIWHLNGCRKVKIQTPSGEISLPKKDAKRLEYLFRELIVYNSAGYTVLGNKPVSFECFTNPQFKWDFLYIWHTFFSSNLKKYRAWKTWQRYEHLFNKGNKILIWSEPSPWIKNGELIVIASKKQVDLILQQNQDDFATLTGRDPKTVFSKALLSHDGLLGILLGYGKTNAWLFYEKNQVRLKPVFSDELNEIFRSKKAALNFTFGWPNIEMSKILMYPNFMADVDSEETKKLKTEYLHTRTKILDHYKNKDFLEATLQLLL